MDSTRTDPMARIRAKIALHEQVVRELHRQLQKALEIQNALLEQLRSTVLN